MKKLIFSDGNRTIIHYTSNIKITKYSICFYANDIQNMENYCCIDKEYLIKIEEEKKMNDNIKLEYSSNSIAILSKCENEELIIISVDNCKVTNCLYGFYGIDNDMVEYAIKHVLKNNSYCDLEEEIELYRKSELYRNIKEYSEVE